MVQQIDLSHGTQVLGDQAAAKKILTMFVEKLPSYVDEITQHHQNAEWHQLYESIHALKGATCYSSTPHLNQTTSDLHDILEKVNHRSLNSHEIQATETLLDKLVCQADDIQKQSAALLD